MSEPTPPLRAAIIPVTPLQQNCTLLWCTATMRGAFVDPGGDLPRLKAAAEQAGVTIEKILLTHGHIDHCGERRRPGRRARRADRGTARGRPLLDRASWLTTAPNTASRPAFRPSRWLVDGDQASVGELTFDVRHCPGHTPGHVVFHHPESKLALVGDVCSRARSAAGTSPTATSSS